MAINNHLPASVRALGSVVGLLAFGPAMTTLVHAAGNNDYASNITVTAGLGVSINGLNLDRTAGKVYVASNHLVRVFPAGLGGQLPEMEFSVDPTGSPGSSPSGVVFENNRYYVSSFWRNGRVYSYDAQGQNQTESFTVNTTLPYNSAGDGSVGMTSNSKGDLLLASKKLTDGKTGLIVKGTDGTTRWLAHPTVDSTGDVLQVAVDQQDNVYAAGDGFGKFVQVYDSAGTPLRQIGPVQGIYSAGVAVDQCNFVYVSSGNNIIEKFDPAGNKVATLQDTARTYGSNRGSRPVSTDATGKHLYMINAAQGFYAVWTQTTSPPPAPSVLASAPTAQEIQTTWNQPAECIKAYHLEISPDGTSWTPVTLTGTPLTRSITSADLPLIPGNTYTLRVNATDPDGTSVYSPTVSVTLPADPTPPTPTAITPPTITATAGNLPARILAQWNAPAANISSYALEISDASFTKATLVQVTVPGSQTSREFTAADVPGMAEGQTYYVRVSATSPDGTSVFSQQASATIPTGSGNGTGGPDPRDRSFTPVPTMSEWALALLATLMVLVGGVRMRKR